MMGEPRIDGCVQFHITTTPDEMRCWPVEAIRQFFDGVAQVVYAAGANAQVEVLPLDDGDNDERDEG